MQSLKLGFCPFRIEKRDFQAGCVLQLGKESLCYSQDCRPLITQNDHLFCPLIKINLSKEIYQNLEQIIAPILAIQDEESFSINLWPLLQGVSSPKHGATTFRGKEMQELSKKVRNKLGDIIFDLT